MPTYPFYKGKLSEWLKEPASKTGVRVTVPGVRIPHLPRYAKRIGRRTDVRRFLCGCIAARKLAFGCQQPHGKRGEASPLFALLSVTEGMRRQLCCRAQSRASRGNAQATPLPSTIPITIPIEKGNDGRCRGGILTGTQGRRPHPKNGRCGLCCPCSSLPYTSSKASRAERRYIPEPGWE